MSKTVVFKARWQRAQDGGSFIQAPVYDVRHAQWRAPDVQIRAALHRARRAGLLPDRIHARAVPEHITIDSSGFLAVVTVMVP